MCQHDDGWVVVLGEKGRLEYILCLHYISRKGHCFDGVCGRVPHLDVKQIMH